MLHFKLFSETRELRFREKTQLENNSATLFHAGAKLSLPVYSHVIPLRLL